MSRFGDWFETRLPVAASFRKLVDEGVPGGARFTYALGSTTLLTFLVLGATGVAASSILRTFLAIAKTSFFRAVNGSFLASSKAWVTSITLPPRPADVSVPKPCAPGNTGRPCWGRKGRGWLGFFGVQMKSALGLWTEKINMPPGDRTRRHSRRSLR